MKGLITGDSFNLDKLRMIVNKATQGVEPDTTDDLCAAYKVMATEAHPDDCIDVNELAQKMNRRLQSDVLTQEMVDAGPRDGGGACAR